jgi:quinol-cytochrome oxidoreductase complex cytochrome b subunit
MAEKVFDWLEERLGLEAIYSAVLDRKVPKVNWWFTLGSASLFLFVMQGVTSPSPESAYDSIQYIMNGVAFGWLVRGIHHWGASLMVITVFIHMLRTFFYGAYKFPREMTWLTGVMLFLLTLGMGFAVTLARFFSAHIWILPLGILLLISTHMYLIIRLGISNIPGEDE